MRLILVFLGALVTISSCESNFLMQEYSSHSNNPEIAHFTIKAISTKLKNQNSEYALLKLLRQHISDHPSDPYNGLYLYTIATIYDSLGSPIFANDFFRLSLYHRGYEHANNYKKDAFLKLARDYSDSYKTLETLIDFDDMDISISRIDLDYLFGTHYDAVANWDAAYDHYSRLFADEENRDKYDDIYIRLRKKNIAFKSIYFDTLEDATTAITTTLVSRNYGKILRIQGKPFFSKNWQVPLQDSNAWIPNFNIAAVFSRSNVSVSSAYSPLSNENYIYIKTTGWDRVFTWYFVLRKISYPDAPNINGKWEWGGIIIGEDSSANRG